MDSLSTKLWMNQMLYVYKLPFNSKKKKLPKLLKDCFSLVVNTQTK